MTLLILFLWYEKYPELYDFQENKVGRGWALLSRLSTGLFPTTFSIKATSTNKRKHPLQVAPYSILAPWVLTIVWFLDSWPKVCWFYWSSESHWLAKVLMVNTVKKSDAPALLYRMRRWTTQLRLVHCGETYEVSSLSSISHIWAE